MTSGRKPKPAALRLIEGNREHRPIPNEPKPRPVAPECPELLTGEAREIWEKTAPELERLGVLTKVDGGAFTAYCLAYEVMIEMAKAIRDAGGIRVYMQGKNSQTTPEISAMWKAMNEVKAFGAEFGLTPSSRTRLVVPGEEDDEFSEFGLEESK